MSSGDRIQHSGARRMVAATLCALLCLTVRPAAAQDIPPASLDAPFADPLVNLDTTLTGLRVSTWSDGTARMMLLEDDVIIRVGAYGFKAKAAVIRLEPDLSDSGRLWHLAAYLQDARPLPGQGAVIAESDELLLTASTLGSVRLENPGDVRQLDAAPPSPLVREARQRIAAHRSAVAGPGLAVPPSVGLRDDAQARRERRREQIAAEQRQLYESAPGQAVINPKDAEDPSARDGRDVSILPARGALAYSMDSWSATVGEQETAVSLVGNVRLVFEDYQTGRVVTLKAERAVLFVGEEDDAPDNAIFGLGQLDAEGLRGVYLEDNVIVSDGQYTVRAPRVFYDMARNRATLLNAVFYTYDAQRQIPLYVRAEAVRQTSSSDFAAQGAKLTTSEFAVPHFSIGAENLTFSQYEAAPGKTGVFFTAEDTTLNVGKTPIFYWPYLAAYGRETPLVGVSAGYNSNNGAQLRTRWDMFALLGKVRPDDARWEASFDYLGDHGLGVGTTATYRTRDSLGALEGYFLPDDSGEDEIGDRTINQTDEQRGYLRAQHRAYLPNEFELSIEGAYVSDPTFLEEFYPQQTLAKPYETSAYLKRQEANTSYDLLATTTLSEYNFMEQLDELQSLGYRVEKYPELGYRVIGGNILDGGATWFSQTSFAQMRIVGGDDEPLDRGFTDPAQTQQLFGIDPTDSFRDRLDQQGIPTESVLRLDSRQEIAVPLMAGGLDITPYAVGRVTAYDGDFADFNGGNDDRVRLWGEVGLRVGTEFSATDSDFRSSILDVDGLRHIVEPNATFFVNGSTLDSEDLPVYDPDVESLSDGSGVRLGVTQTWQTRRGGLGRERTVDWVTWRNDVVLKADDADIDTPIARFYDYRPEYSVGGDHYYTELLWMVTDTLGVAGELTHSFESDRVAQWRIGATLDHTPRLSSFLSYEEIDPLNSQLLSYGFYYQLTTKYRVGFSQTLDFAESDARSVALLVDRRLPRWTMRVKASYDEIDDETRVGVTLIPDGRGPSDDGPTDVRFN